MDAVPGPRAEIVVVAAPGWVVVTAAVIIVVYWMRRAMVLMRLLESLETRLRSWKTLTVRLESRLGAFVLMDGVDFGLLFFVVFGVF